MKMLDLKKAFSQRRLNSIIGLFIFSLLLSGCNIYDLFYYEYNETQIPIKGIVLDKETNIPLPDIRVMAIPTSMDTSVFLSSIFSQIFPGVSSTNEKGEFELTVTDNGTYAFIAGHIMQDNYVPVLEYDIKKMRPILPVYDIDTLSTIKLFLQKGIILYDATGKTWNSSIYISSSDTSGYRLAWGKLYNPGDDLLGYMLIIWNSHGPVWSIPSSLDTLTPEIALNELIQDTTFTIPKSVLQTLDKGEYRLLVGAITYSGEKFKLIPSEPLGGKFVLEE